MSDTSQLSSSKLPQELYDDIIDCLHDHPASLRSCALTCRSFVVRSQRHLFSDVCLSTDPFRWSIMMRYNPFFADAGCFRSMLEVSPHLASYVLNLHIESRVPRPKRNSEESSYIRRLLTSFEGISESEFCEVEEDEEQLARRRRLEQDVIHCLRQLSHLRCLSVGTQYRSLTAENEPEFIEALKNVASLPSLICLRQFSMFDLLFKQRTHLPYLSICIGEGGLVHLPAEPDPLSKPRNRCQVEFLRVTQGSIARALHRYSRKIHLEQLLDIEKLRCLFILASNLSPFKTQNMLNLLRVSHYNLQEFILYLSSPGSFSSPGEELRVALEELRSLRRLRIRVTDFGLTPCLLMHISWLLMSLPTGAASCLEQISIQTIYLRKPRSRHSPELTLEPWDELWDLVADFDRFPCLTSLEFMGYFGLTHDSDKDVVHPEAMKWQAHLAEKQSFSSRLKVEAKILKYANAINEDDFYPEFWPDDGFRRLLGKNCD